MAEEFRTLKSSFAQGNISRREFLARATALGVASAIPISLWSNIAQAEQPKKGGRLRVGLSDASTSDSMDTGGGCCSVWESWIQFQFRNHLVEIDPKGKPIPELAESWESTPDAQKWIFKIRKGVEFHNGKTLDANDVVYSLNHHRGDESKSPAKAVLSGISDIKADGKHAVVIEAQGGYADMPSLMSDYHLMIIPDGYKTWETCMGTGPYMMKNYEPGVSFFSIRNPNYWKEGRAHFDEIETTGIHDPATRTSALRSGNIDVMNNPDLRTIDLLGKAPGLQIIRTPGLRHFSIPMMTDIEPYSNNDVRLGLKYAIDREELLNKILRGYGTLGNDHPIAPIMRYYAKELPQREFDLEKARFHFKKAGLEGYTFKLHVADKAYPGAIDTALFMKESAAKAGINIQVVREPDDAYWTSVWRHKPWSFCSWSGRVTEDMMFSTAYAEDAKWNDAHWKHEKFNKLLKAGRIELDDTKRREIYTEMQKIVRDEGGTVVHLFTDHVIAASSKLKFEAPMAGHFEMDGQRGSEKWWFES